MATGTLNKIIALLRPPYGAETDVERLIALSAARELLPPRTVNSFAAATLIGVEEGTLRVWRSTGRGPKFIRTATGHIEYAVADITTWIEEQ